MRLSSSTIRWFLPIVAAAATLSCNRATPDTSAGLRIAVREGLEADGIRALARAWEQRTGTKATVQAFGRDNYEVDTTNDLVSEHPQYDVVFFPGTLVPEMAQRGGLAAIEGWSPDSDKDLLTYTSYNGRIFGLPCDVSTFFLFYRSDIVKQLPDTWGELLKMAPKFSRKNNPQMPTAYGLVLGAKAGEDLIKGFYVLLWSSGGFIVENGQVGLDSPGAIAAGQLLRDMVRSSAAPPDIQTWEVTKILDQLSKGTVAIAAPEWNAVYPLLQADAVGSGKKVGIARIPGVRQADGSVQRVNFKQSWVLVKSAKGKQQSRANDFILFATGPDGGRLYANTAHGNPARTSLLSDPELQKARPEFPLLLESLKTAKAEPEVPYYAKLSSIVNDALTAIVAGTAEPEAALREGASKVRTLVQ